MNNLNALFHQSAYSNAYVSQPPVAQTEVTYAKSGDMDDLRQSVSEISDKIQSMKMKDSNSSSKSDSFFDIHIDKDANQNYVVRISIWRVVLFFLLFSFIFSFLLTLTLLLLNALTKIFK